MLLAVMAILFALVILFGPQIRRYLNSDPAKTVDLAYTKRATLLSIAEQRFFEAVRTAVPAELQVCPKVRVADVLACPSDASSRQVAFNKISQKHLDFVIIEAQSSKILVAIELDDSSHQRARRVQRDAFLLAALERAKLPLLRIPAAATYAPHELRAQIEGSYSKTT